MVFTFIFKTGTKRYIKIFVIININVTRAKNDALTCLMEICQTCNIKQQKEPMNSRHIATIPIKKNDMIIEQ